MWLITASLHNAYRYYHYNDFATEEDFLNTLRKVKTPPSEAMIKGMEFEDKIRKISEENLVLDEETDAVKEIVPLVRGGEWQKVCKKEFDGNLLYGKIDVYFPKIIFDIKYTSSYDLMKFSHGIQHLLYMYCTGVEYFDYLVGLKGKDFVKESYNWNNEFSKKQLRNRINEMLDFIFSVPKFREAFEENWKAKEETRH